MQSMACDFASFLGSGLASSVGGKKYRSPGNWYQVLGTAVHTRAEYHYLGAMLRSPWGTPDEEIREQFGEYERLGEALTTSAAMWEKVRLQAERWGDFRPYSVEQTLWATLGELDPNCPAKLRDEVVTSRSDLIVDLPSGARAVVDFKTVGSAYQKKPKGAKKAPARLPVWKPQGPKWGMHAQAALTLRLAQLRLGDVSDFVIVRISRDDPYPSDRKRIEIPPRFMDEIGALATEAVKREWSAVRRAQQGNLPLQTGAFTGACAAWGGCKYLPVCTSGSEAEAQHELQLMIES